MKDRRLAVRYANALLSVLTDPAQAESADRFLGAIRQAMSDSDELRDLLLNPAVPRTHRTAVLRSLAEAKGMRGEMGNFLETLVEHNRTAVLPQIAEVFHERREEAMGVVPAELTTAMPLTDEQQARAKQALERLTGSTVRLSYQVDEALLGGAVTRIGSKVYDGSLRTQLAELRRQMAQE